MSPINDKSYKMQTMTNTIESTLSEYPELLGSALNAIAMGMANGLESESRRFSKLNAAFLSALALFMRDRKSKNFTGQLGEVILEYFNEHGVHCELERKAVDKINGDKDVKND
jgi:hypothetical protein